MNANYKNNNKNAIVKKIESNFQQQYKGNMNNKKLQATTTNNNNNNKNAIVNKIEINFQEPYKGNMNNKKEQPTTNNMANNNHTIIEERIKAFMESVKGSGARNEFLNKEDPNQYYRIVNKKKYIKNITHQIKTGEANGNCMKENLYLLGDIIVGIKTQNKTETATEAKYFHYQYGDERNGKEYIGNHMAVMVKINNVWYVRCHSNCIEQQRELNGWFQDRRHFKLIGKPSYLPYSMEGNQITLHLDGVEKFIPFKINPYFNHNKIVLTARNEW